MRSSWRLVVAVAGVLCVISCCTPIPAGALPPGHRYELVSPVFKGGFGALRVAAVSPDGERVVFYSPGAFAGAPAGLDTADYMARRRGPGEWATAPLVAPVSLVTNYQIVDFSPSLETEFEIGYPGSDYEGALPVANLLLHPTDLPDIVENWETIGRLEALDKSQNGIEEVDATPDFCHVLLTSGKPLLPLAEGTEHSLYELDRGCAGENPSLRLVGVNNKGSEGELINPGCGVDVGDRRYSFNGPSAFNAVSSDGAETFFTVCMSGETSATSPHQLFVRLAGARTVEVSRPLAEACTEEVPCPQAPSRGSAEFEGASEDGSRVFFAVPQRTGQEPLVPGDTDATNNLYMARIGCPASKPRCATAERAVTSLTQVSRDPSGGPANVLGVLRVAPDGERVYFVATGDLLTAAQRQRLEAEGRALPQAGADNLYVYDGTSSPGSISFIGDLCSKREGSGSSEDIRCPSETGTDSSLWSSQGSSGSEAQTAEPDGRFLVFSSYAQLSGDDVNAARDVYRYDAQTGDLERVSIGEGGYSANGNHGLLGSGIVAGNHGEGSEAGTGAVHKQYETNTRAISEDGSRIVFISAEPLSPLAGNSMAHVANVYEWHEAPGGDGGSVSLVDSGNGAEPVEDAVISPDGSSIVFKTAERLVPQDVDGAPDIYDARLEAPGETLPSVPAKLRQCEGDECQGPLTNPAPLLVPGSMSQAPGQNVPPPAPPKPACKHGYKRNAHGKCVKTKARKVTKARRRAHKTKKTRGGKS